MAFLPECCVRGSMHQGSSLFSEDSRSRQCCPMSFFALLYSNVVDVDSWTGHLGQLISYCLKVIPYTSLSDMMKYTSIIMNCRGLSVLIILTLLCQLLFSVIILVFCTPVLHHQISNVLRMQSLMRVTFLLDAW